ncbi:hypothetical protein DSO57_1029844 [Entomophthora muscae]|uniref:Uncharacterized protein n=1 Tax=Entomophthora muscae TaxID=34485 RepID=A0ACC2RFT6_9FUNG|nr:hypothetical protein DSO57_1029844 [Entomophthora muscae]
MYPMEIHSELLVGVYYSQTLSFSDSVVSLVNIERAQAVSYRVFKSLRVQFGENTPNSSQDSVFMDHKQIGKVRIHQYWGSSQCSFESVNCCLASQSSEKVHICHGRFHNARNYMAK